MNKRPSEKSSLSARLVRKGLAGLAAVAAIAGLSSGCLDRPVSKQRPNTTNVFVDQIRQQGVDKIDLLFMIDNSISMADKQNILADAVPELVRRLVTPICVDQATGNLTGCNADSNGACPCGGEPEFKPIKDIHIGVISSSLGAHGGDICNPANAQPGSTPDDKARLIGSQRPGVNSFNNLGFLWWAPEKGGATDSNALIADFAAHVKATGENGCGYEASLEAWYRFLIDPEPPLDVVKENGFAVVQGVDDVVLQQRKDFLRGDSLVSIIMLSDENDCSIRDGGQGILGQAWLVSTQSSGGVGLPRATTTCDTKPDDPCCHSCGQGDVPGCPPVGSDANCSKGNYPDTEDHLNLRCWEQKRRFGVDWLYPTQRYVDGLKNPRVFTRAGVDVPNPLFLNESGTSRDPNLIYLAGIVGVPWQLISDQASQDPNNPTLKYLTAGELDQNGVWPKITWTAGNPPTDPHMVESFLPRAGLPDPNAGPLADPIHGHEWDIVAAGSTTGPGDLQYACIFPLVPERDCAGKGTGCDCSNVGAGYTANNPLCQAQSGQYTTTQRFAKAYPGLRELQVLRDFGENSIVASICPKNVTGDKTSVNYGYNPAVSAIIERLKEVLTVKCLPRPLDVQDDGTVQCAIVEVLAGAGGACTEPGREPVAAELVKPVQAQLAKTGQCGPTSANGTPCTDYTLCAIKPTLGADLQSCQTDPNTSSIGWCYVDPDNGVGNPALVATCPATDRRLLRFVGADTPKSGATVFIACLGAPIAQPTGGAAGAGP